MPESLTSPNVDNYYIGKGIVSIKKPGDVDYVDVGNVPEFEYTPDLAKLDHFTSRTGIRSKDKSIVLEKSAQLRMVMEEWTARNLALMLMSVPDETNPAAVTMDILSEGSITCAVKFVGQNDVGPKWTFEFPRVEFTPSGSLNVISDDDWSGIEITGDILVDLVSGKFGTATADLSGAS